MSTKEAFHQLIDRIQDEEVLKGYFELIQHLDSNQTGSLWNSLSESEKAELLISFNESFDPKNLVSHDNVKRQHKKWLDE